MQKKKNLVRFFSLKIKVLCLVWICDMTDCLDKVIYQRKFIKIYFQPGPMSELLTITNLRDAMTRITLKGTYALILLNEVLQQCSMCEKCPYLEFFQSVLSPNAGKHGPGKLRIRTLFTQCLVIAQRCNIVTHNLSVPLNTSIKGRRPILTSILLICALYFSASQNSVDVLLEVHLD